MSDIRELMVEYLKKCNTISPNCLEAATLSIYEETLRKNEIKNSPIVFNTDGSTSQLGLINGFMDYINMPRIRFTIDEETEHILEIE